MIFCRNSEFWPASGAVLLSPPPFGGKGGKFSPISGARKKLATHLGGWEFSRFHGFFDVFHSELGWKRWKTTFFGRRLRRAVKKKDLELFFDDFQKFPPIRSKISPQILSVRTRWGEIFPPFWEENENTGHRAHNCWSKVYVFDQKSPMSRFGSYFESVFVRFVSMSAFFLVFSKPAKVLIKVLEKTLRIFTVFLDLKNIHGARR